MQVTASAWLNDLRNQIERTRILSTVYRSATALGSRLPSIAVARARVAGAGAILRPVSNGTQVRLLQYAALFHFPFWVVRISAEQVFALPPLAQVVMKRARNVAQAAWSRPPLRLPSWSCMGPRRRSAATSVVASLRGGEGGDMVVASVVSAETVGSDAESTAALTSTDGGGWSSEVVPSGEEGGDGEDGMSEVELWQQLEDELYRRRRETEETDVVKEIREEEKAAAAAAEGVNESLLPPAAEARRFFPPGRIMHIVSLLPEEEKAEEGGGGGGGADLSPRPDPKVGIFLTPRSLYGKLRLSQMMINDHYMPIYRRNMEALIEEFEEAAAVAAEGDSEVDLALT